MRLRLLLLACVALVASGCGLFGSRTSRENPSEVRAAIQRAHDGYVAAINTNRADRWLTTLDDEVTYLVPNQPAIVGKVAVGTWVSRYLHEVTTVWTKTIVDLQVAGEWAVARYTYTASDSIVIRDPETEGGGTANDSGWGLAVYHRSGDGTWRVARDAWGSDRPAR